MESNKMHEYIEGITGVSNHQKKRELEEAVKTIDDEIYRTDWKSAAKTGKTISKLASWIDKNEPKNESEDMMTFNDYMNVKDESLTESQEAQLDDAIALFLSEGYDATDLDREMLEEGLFGSILGGLTGAAVGKGIGKMLAKILGVQKGILYDLLTSRLVGAAIGSKIGNRF